MPKKKKSLFRLSASLKFHAIVSLPFRPAKKNSASLLFIAFLLLSFFFCSSLVAAPIDAGSLLSEQKQDSVKYMKDGLPEDAEMLPELQSISGPLVFVKNIQYSGYENMTTLKALEKRTAPYRDRECSFEELKRLAQEVTNHLRQEKGFLLATAYLPEQDVTDGIVRIDIIPGKLDGTVDLFVSEGHRVKKEVLEKIASRAIPEGETVYLKNLERATLLINDLPALSARAYLDKGEAPGTTKISIHAEESKWSRGAFFADNFGNRYTGAFRRIGQISFNDSLGYGDLVTLSYINADDLNQGKVNFIVPINSYGTVFDASYALLDYELRAKWESLNISGSAHTVSSALRHPLLRTRASSVWISSGYEYYLMKDEINNRTTSARDISAGTMNIAGNFYDSFFNGGLSSLYAAVYGGCLDIDKGKDDDDQGPRRDGGFTRMTYAATRLQRLSKNTSSFMAIRGQIAEGNLDSSQKIILGGPTGVRAYPVGEASGDEGHILTIEGRFDLPRFPYELKMQLVGFIDAGHIRLHDDLWDNAVSSISGRNSYWLLGAGPGITVEKTGVFRIQFSYAHQIGRNAGRDSSGNAADDRDARGRFWLQGTVQF